MLVNLTRREHEIIQYLPIIDYLLLVILVGYGIPVWRDDD